MPRMLALRGYLRLSPSHWQVIIHRLSLSGAHVGRLSLDGRLKYLRPHRLFVPRFIASSSYRPPVSMSISVVEITVPATGKKISVPTGLFINNKFVPSVDSQETLECVLRYLHLRGSILIGADV